MEFHEKLQELRKQKGLTQEELASALFVSRAAVSKWESGRGYPNIESLKAVAKFYRVTVDELLSGEELMTLAEERCREMQKRYQDLVFGLLDASTAVFFLLPLLRENTQGHLRAVSLPVLSGISPWLKICYIVCVAAMSAWGILTLALQGCQNPLWQKVKTFISLIGGGGAVLLFTLSMQPYGAALLFIFLAIKVVIAAKNR